MYAHEKRQQREQWDRDKAASAQAQRAQHEEYDRERAEAFEQFRCSAEGSQVYEKTFPILLVLHKHTDPLSAYETAREATLSRMNRQDFKFPEFTEWMANRPATNSTEAD